MGGILSDQYWGNQFEKLSNYGVDRRLTLRSIKLVGDGEHIIYYILIRMQMIVWLGALGSWGAAMTEPYSDNPSTKGTLLQSEETFEYLISRFFEDGWQVVSSRAFRDFKRSLTYILEHALHWRSCKSRYSKHS